MRKRKPIIIESHEGSVVLNWTGPAKPGKYIGYIKVDGGMGDNFGGMTEPQMRQLYGWLKRHYTRKEVP